MRGRDQRSGSLFSYMDLEDRVPRDHPLRVIRGIVNDVLGSLSSDFEALYSPTGRPSIPPEKLLRALLLQAFYSIRSERQLMEQLDFNLLFRWFVGIGIDDPVWDASSFCHNRDRFLEADVSAHLLNGVVEHKLVRRLLSRDHFSVDGTLIEAWASMKSFRRKDGADDDPGCDRNGERDFRGEKRSNESHESTTDPEARLYRKGNGRESKLCFMGHALMENRNGLTVGGGVTIASGMAEREAALDLIDKHRPMERTGGKRRITLGGDKGFDVADFVEELRERKVTPHVAVQDRLTKTGKRRKTKIDGRTTRHPGYAVSQRCRKRIEEIFGWAKTQAGQAKTRFRGGDGWRPRLHWRWPPTISSDCPSCWRRRPHDHAQTPSKTHLAQWETARYKPNRRDQARTGQKCSRKTRKKLGSRQFFSSLLDHPTAVSSDDALSRRAQPSSTCSAALNST